jgi:Family of unknown function (DUF6765)
MQIDMHYYGTYALARAAGLNPEATKIIATAAQFVDDNADKKSIEFRDGGRLDAEATAHHAINLKNIDREDQRKIWVPFHFLPGNQGTAYTERLICRMDSPILKEMLKFTLSKVKQKEPYAQQLIGITAHVYADTFAHYGFSGISSRRNKIEGKSFEFKGLTPKMETYIDMKAKKFRENYPLEEGLLANVKSWFGETFSGALGHGAAATYPDRPYLVWNFDYEYPDKPSPLRNNPQTFLKGAHALHDFFCKVAKTNPEFAAGKQVKFSAIESNVKAIIEKQGKKKDRIKDWQRAARQGNVFAAAGPIPSYSADNWLNQRSQLKRRKDSSEAGNTVIFRFYQAASVFRLHLLRNVLPEYGLVVS